MDFCPLVCGFEQSCPKVVVPYEGTVLLLPTLVLCSEGFCILLKKESGGRGICVWRNCDSVQHDKNKVLLLPLRLIMRRVELVAVDFIVFLQVILFFSLPCLFLLDFLGGFSFCCLISRENILLFSLASCVRPMF